MAYNGRALANLHECKIAVGGHPCKLGEGFQAVQSQPIRKPEPLTRCCRISKKLFDLHVIRICNGDQKFDTSGSTEAETYHAARLTIVFQYSP